MMKILRQGWLGTVAMLALLVWTPAHADFIPVENVHIAQQTVTLNGLTRTVVTLSPASGTTGKVPVLFLLHYKGGNPIDFIDLADVGKLVRDYGIWVVAPQSSSSGQWNWGLDPSGPDDVGFLTQLIAKVTAEDPVDPRRVFMAGYSDGGGMTEQMACSMPQLIAGGAVVAAKLTITMKNACKPALGTPMLFFAGTDDHISRYPPIIGQVSVPATAQFWAGTAGCSATPVVTDLPNSIDDNTGTTVTFSDYSTGCKSYGGTELYTVNGGGHTWPGAFDYTPVLGVTTQQISATQLMWQFFSGLSR